MDLILSVVVYLGAHQKFINLEEKEGAMLLLDDLLPLPFSLFGVAKVWLPKRRGELDIFFKKNLAKLKF